MRKLALVVVALAVVTFVLGLIVDEAALKILAPLLVIAASILNIASPRPSNRTHRLAMSEIPAPSGNRATHLSVPGFLVAQRTIGANEDEVRMEHVLKLGNVGVELSPLE